jgi:hypothetical protein
MVHAESQPTIITLLDYLCSNKLGIENLKSQSITILTIILLILWVKEKGKKRSSLASFDRQSSSHFLRKHMKG